MARIIQKTNREKRKLRVRKHVFGTTDRPRLSVFKSNRYITGQLIDDEKGITIVDVQAEAKKMHDKKSKLEAAAEVGKLLATKAKEAKVTKVVFDRNGYKYHGRVKSFADGAREGGLDF